MPLGTISCLLSAWNLCFPGSTPQGESIPSPS